jgi:hypothetical protein
MNEFKSWQLQSEEEWTLVSPNKRRTDRALMALQSRPQKSILRKKSSVHLALRKISFATFQQYDACIGYEHPMSAEDAKMALEAGYDYPQIRKHAGVLISSDIPRQSALVQFGSVQSPVPPSASDPSDPSRGNRKNGFNSNT